MNPQRSFRLAYELNPPAVLGAGPPRNGIVRADIKLFLDRVEQISLHVDSLHLTDSVLGTPRISSVCAAALIKDKVRHSLRLVCNLRTCDHSLNGIVQMVGEAHALGVKGIALVRGDLPMHGVPLRNDPVKVLSYLREIGFQGDEIKLYLTTSPDATPSSLALKLRAKPDGFVTKTITSIESFERLSDYLMSRGMEVMAPILVPSEKNRLPAKLVGLDWASYSDDVVSFVRRVGRKASEVVLSSPNHFASGLTVASLVGGSK